MEKLILALAFLNLLLIIYFILFTRKSWIKLFNSISKKSLLIVSLLCLANVIFILLFFPLAHRFFVDESFYMGAAKNIVRERAITLDDVKYEKQAGWPVLLSIAFFFSGVDNFNAIYFSIILSTASVFAFFIFNFLLFRSEKAALLSAFFYLFIPLRLALSASAETITASILFVLLVLISFMLYFNEKDYRIQFLGWLLFCFAIQIRLENILLLIPIVYLFYKHKELPSIRALFLLPFIASFIAQYFILRNFYFTAYSGRITFFGIETIASKLVVFFNSLENLLVVFYIVLIAIGIILIWRKNHFIFYCVLPYFFFYLIYNYSDIFHFLPGICFSVSLCGISISMLNRKAIFLILALLVVVFAFFAPMNEDEYFTLETRMLHNISIPENCTLISARPLFLNSVHSYRTYSIAQFFETTKRTPDFFKCAYFAEDMLCFKSYYTYYAGKECERMKKMSNKLYSSFSYKNITFSVYELDLTAQIATFIK